MSENERREVTPEGKKMLEEKLATLEGVRRAEVAEKLRVARSYGDLSENAEWDAAKNESAALESEIMELKNIIKNLIVVEKVDKSAKSANLGAIVEVEYLEDGEKETYELTGALESDPMGGKISVESPVGKALMGHEAGETVTVQLPDDEQFKLRLLSVTYR